MGANAWAELGDLAFDAVILGVPAISGLFLAHRLKVRSRAVQAIFVLSAPCLLAYVAGGFYLISPSAGRLVTYVCYGAFIAVAVYLGAALKRRLFRIVVAWLPLVGMTLGAAAFCLGLGYLHGYTTHPVLEALAVATPRFRYLRSLPTDNTLPLAFASQLLSRVRPLPHFLINGWESSDRPPLQTAMYLVVHAFTPSGDTSGLNYEVTGVLLQSLWMPALWCFLSAARLPRRAIAVGLAVSLTSGFVILNSFFTWPKLFPAAFIVLLGAVVFTDQWDGQRSSVVAGLACGLASAMAMLGHEGSALALLPLVVFVAARVRSWPRLRFVLPAVLVFVSLMVPWTLYQSHYDPPGTKLAKQQLGGPAAVQSHKGLVSSIVAAYDRLDAGQIAHNKLTNLETPFSNEGVELKSLVKLGTNLFADGGKGGSRRDSAIIELRNLSFFYLLPAIGLMALGFFSLALLVMRRRARSPSARVAVRTWAWLALGLFFWALLLFGPRYTVIHQGSYATELLVLGATTIGLWELSHRLTYVVAAFQVALGVIVYGVFQPSLTKVHTVVPPAIGDEAALAIVGIVVALALAIVAKDGEVSSA